MALDLRYLRPQLSELLLVDTCELYRDLEGASDDVTDPVTGSVTSADDLDLVATLPCKLRTTLFRNVTVIEGGEVQTMGHYVLSVPADSVPDVYPGDWVRMVSSVHDPDVDGKWFRVAEILHSTFSLFQKWRMELRERQRDRS